LRDIAGLMKVTPQEINAMFGRVARRYDFLNHVLAGGLDYYWRWRLMRAVRHTKPQRVLDLATGSGDVLLALNNGRAYSQQAAGADFCAPMLQEARRKGLSALAVADATRLPYRNASFDAITIAFGFRNVVDRAAALREIRRVLRPGGWLHILEFSHPWSWLAGPYFFYLRRILPALAGVFGTDRDAYVYLGESIAAFPRQQELAEQLSFAGYESVRFVNLTIGIVALHSAQKL
jgi:demethylmenaquinone methyltransferase/2-methoxy-6-polyprenyl-1,4-benzoquinol methylase